MPLTPSAIARSCWLKFMPLREEAALDHNSDRCMCVELYSGSLTMGRKQPKQNKTINKNIVAPESTGLGRHGSRLLTCFTWCSQTVWGSVTRVVRTPACRMAAGWLCSAHLDCEPHPGLGSPPRECIAAWAASRRGGWVPSMDVPGRSTSCPSQDLAQTLACCHFLCVLLVKAVTEPRRIQRGGRGCTAASLSVGGSCENLWPPLATPH